MKSVLFHALSSPPLSLWERVTLGRVRARLKIKPFF
jgi:hypothetical protein